MSTTTQILFNSPALHSLKREQLVKLCKIHSIKATGKNAELIERLKQRAQEVPQNGLTNTSNIDEKDLLSDTCGSDEDANPAVNASSLNLPRPSEQWEIVMEDIEEVVESSSMGTSSSKGTFRNASGFTGEFGTGNSKSEYTRLLILLQTNIISVIKNVVRWMNAGRAISRNLCYNA